jgi:hypothetical protein
MKYPQSQKERKQRKNVYNEEKPKRCVQGENATYQFKLWNGKDVEELALYRLQQRVSNENSHLNSPLFTSNATQTYNANNINIQYKQQRTFTTHNKNNAIDQLTFQHNKHALLLFFVVDDYITLLYKI